MNNRQGGIGLSPREIFIRHGFLLVAIFSFILLLASCGALDTGGSGGGAGAGNPPSITSIFATPSAVARGDQVTLTANFSDPDGDVVGGKLIVDCDYLEQFVMDLDNATLFPEPWRLPSATITIKIFPMEAKTISLSVVLQDAAGNRSAPKIVALTAIQPGSGTLPTNPDESATLTVYGYIPLSFWVSYDDPKQISRASELTLSSLESARNVNGNTVNGRLWIAPIKMKISNIAGLRSLEEDGTPIFILDDEHKEKTIEISGLPEVVLFNDSSPLVSYEFESVSFNNQEIAASDVASGVFSYSVPPTLSDGQTFDEITLTFTYRFIENDLTKSSSGFTTISGTSRIIFQ